MNPSSKVILPVSLSFKRLNKILNDKLRGKELVKGFILKNTELTNEDGQGLLYLNLQGVLELKIKALFNLRIAQGYLNIENLQLGINSTKAIASGVNRLIKGWVRDNLEDKINNVILDETNKLRGKILDREKEISLYDDIKLVINPSEIIFDSALITDKGLECLFRGDIIFHILDQ